LFDTGKEYFAYCMITTDVFIGEEGVSLITEDAMANVTKYLNQNKTQKDAINGKKKVLVVDDSEFMLKMMQKLFSEAYEVKLIRNVLKEW